MRKIIFIRFTLVVLFGVIVGFGAVIYWSVWQRSPDYFIVQQEVNLYPFGNIYSLLWEDQFTSSLVESGGLVDLSTEANKLIVKAKELKDRQQRLEQEMLRLEAESKRLSTRLEENRSKRIEEYRRRELAPLESEKERLEAQIAEVEKQISPDGKFFDPLRKVAADLSLKLAEHNLLLSQRRLEVATQIVDDYAKFAEPEDINAWKVVYDQLGIALDEQIATSNSYAALRGEAWRLTAKWHEQRTGRLGFTDFLYFSLGVSTTTTFGDIIPNHSFVRLLVSIQLVISIIIVGLFINSLSPGLQKSDQPVALPDKQSKRKRRRVRAYSSRFLS